MRKLHKIYEVSPSGDSVIGKAGDISLSLLDDGHGEDSEVSVDNTSTDRFPLTLSSTPWAVASCSLGLYIYKS